jgi:hypothetical protein
MQAKGGDPESNPAFLFICDGAGTTCTGYLVHMLLLMITEDLLDFPPASFVATTYMRKHINISSITLDYFSGIIR